MRFHVRNKFSLGEELKSSEKKMLAELEILFSSAIDTRLADYKGKKVAVAFSGGIDSTLIAYFLKKKKIKFTCYTAAFVDKTIRVPQDLVWSKKVAKKLGFPLKVVQIGFKDVEKVLKDVVGIIGTPDVVKVGVGTTLYLVASQAKKDGCVAMFNGGGSEEIFAGYQRHLDVLRKGEDVNKECYDGLCRIYERDSERDAAISAAIGVDLLLPFMDNELIGYGLRIPAKYKISEQHKKIILRKMALTLGIPREIAYRPKLAAQYGSNTDKAIEKLTRRNKFTYKKDYLVSLMQKKGNKKVLVFGTFDLLHKGHEFFLKTAASYGDELHVILGRDKTISYVKGKKPLHNEQKRRHNLEKLSYVSFVHLGSHGDKYEKIIKLKPDVICLGYDQKHFVDELLPLAKKHGIMIRRLGPYKEKVYKSSVLRKKIKK